MRNFLRTIQIKDSSIVLNNTPCVLVKPHAFLVVLGKCYYHNNQTKHVDVKRTKKECRLKPYVKEIPEYRHSLLVKKIHLFRMLRSFREGQLT